MKVIFLLYANEFDVEGLVASSDTFSNIAQRMDWCVNQDATK